MRPASLGVLLAATMLAARPGRAPLGAQERARARVGAQAVLLVTRATPAFGGDSYTEAYVTQPALMAHLPLFGARASLTATLNLEPLTLRRGELNAGIFGEGYVDRRHPHTLLHELMLGAGAERGAIRGSLAAGKGFVPFGTDDPMVRPFAKYPVNHHYAQILERAVAVGALSWRGRVALEGAAFNGDEPEGVYDLPNLRRFGDSWAGRLTMLPIAGLEAQGSVARVASPENALGGGMDQRKSSVAARWAGPRLTMLAEWARTDEYSRRRHAFRYESVLAEASARWRRAELGLRAERTTRPEEQRMADAFRAPRPHDDFSILGLTRWRVLTARAALAGWGRGGRGGRAAEPFVEIARSRATPLQSPSLFVPRDFYGASTLWSLSAGVRLRAGSQHARMGRYGAGALEADGGHHHER